MNVAPYKNIIHSLHWQSRGIHLLSPFLKLVKYFKDFISSGTCFHIFGPMLRYSFFPFIYCIKR